MISNSFSVKKKIRILVIKVK